MLRWPPVVPVIWPKVVPVAVLKPVFGLPQRTEFVTLYAAELMQFRGGINNQTIAECARAGAVFFLDAFVEEVLQEVEVLLHGLLFSVYIVSYRFIPF